MLSNVSWSEYLAAVVILLVLYYVIIGLKYYRKEITSLLSGKLPNKDNTSKNVLKSPEGRQQDAPSFDELEAVVNDLRYSILDKAGNPAIKAELLGQLKQRLASYAGLRRPAYRVAINNYIITHAKEICGVVFSESELEAAWEALLR